MFFLKRCGIWILRFRNRCGYGVHSPFAFNFITGVVYEKGTYYAYDSLKRTHAKYLPSFMSREIKQLRLLFRLSNYAHPRYLFVWQATPTEEAYLQAGCTSARIMRVSSDKGIPADTEVDMCYVALGEGFEGILPSLLARTHSRSIWVISGIYSNAARKHLWRQLCEDGHVGVTFDLYDYGIAFFDRSLNKQHYVVNF